jgi:HK97 family phage major capsid protein
MSVSMESQIRSFSSANQSSAYFTVDLTQGGLTRLNGRPVTVTDYMPTYTSGNTSNTSFCVIGDWSSYLVAMRAGLNVEAIQTLFDTTTNRPIGSRGFFGYLRAGADVINTAGMKILDQT